MVGGIKDGIILGMIESGINGEGVMGNDVGEKGGTKASDIYVDVNATNKIMGGKFEKRRKG